MENNDSKKLKWESHSIEEQEVIINVDYAGKYFDVYTSKSSVGKALLRKLGTPDDQQVYNGRIVSQEWRVPFDDRKKLNKVLSIKNYVSYYSSDSSKRVSK